MSDSDEDFFLPSQKMKQIDLVSAKRVSAVKYFFVVSFNWNLMVANPFEIHVLESIRDFPDEWITGPLTTENRLRKVTINVLEGQYSLFCKVEKGSILVQFRLKLHMIYPINIDYRN